MVQDESNVTRPSHLPRLRNRASLGRLVVFGGVLDFQGHPPAISTSTTDRTLPAMPLIPHLYSHLAGPAPSSPSTSQLVQEPPLMQSHSKQHRGQGAQHTPVKHTNSSTTLAALQALNSHHQEAKYPTLLSNGRPLAIPRLDLDFDHHGSHQHNQHRQSHRIRPGHNQSRSHSQSRSSSAASSSSLQSGVGGNNSRVLDSDGDVTEELGRRTTTRTTKQREEIEEEKRLVNEIRKDMDEGGYASLEQILARNGFKVCRVATPPSTGRVASTKHTGTTPSSTEESTEEIHHHHPLSKIISASSSTLTATVKQPQAKLNSSSNISIVEERTTTTLKSKPSMLSFSGIVSNFWSASTGKDATTIPKQSISDSPTSPPDHDNSGPRSSIPRNSEDILGNVAAGQSGNVVVDRNEEIKGWLRQTFDASNAYMNEARRTIEAARMAMGSPEKKKTTVQKKESEIEQSVSLACSKGTEIEMGNTEDEQEEESDENNLSLSLHEQIERRQATTSTLESELIETPNCSPITLNHPSSSISITQSTSASKMTIKDEEASIHNPPYSPPLSLSNSNMEQPAINHQVTYFDSPLMRRKMNRISLQTRQESLSHQQQQRNEQEIQYWKRTEVVAVEYPPSSPDLKNVPKRQEERFLLDENNNNEASQDKQREKGKKNSSLSAESLLRGTLRCAVSESTFHSTKSEERIERDGTVQKGNAVPPGIGPAAAVKNGHRPSIASIFGIPISFPSSLSSSTSMEASSSASATATLADEALVKKKIDQEEEEREGIYPLKQSTTDSLLSRETNSSLDTRSTSAKDTISTNSISMRKSTMTSNSNAPPKLLRKTASKHTLRKAASPILSSNNAAIAVYSDDLDNENLDSVTPVKNKPTAIHTKIHNDDFTPVKNRPVGIRGPLPIKTPSPSSSSTTTTTTSAITDSVERRNITPRQLAHRNPRDSPVGETRVVRSPPSSLVGISKRIVAGSQVQSTAGTPVKKISGIGKDGRRVSAQPGIMDDETDNDGLWSPPKDTSRSIITNSSTTPKRAPLGAMRMGVQEQQRQNENAQKAASQQKGKNEVKPRLKAKESLERLLAYKQMQEDDSSKDIIPPVPALPTQTQLYVHSTSDSDSKQAGPIPSTDASNSNSSSTASSPQVLLKSTTEEAKNRSDNNTLKHKSSFGGTLRGLIGSAVAGWAESTTPMMMTGDRNAPVSSQMITSTSSSRRVTILPAQKPLSSTRNGKNGNSNTTSAFTNGKSGKSIRRARSMYVDNKARKMGDRDGDNTASWMSMERERNNLVLPTIIISDYTQ